MAEDTKNVSVLEEQEREFDRPKPSKKEEEVISATFTKFREVADHRNQHFQFLDGQSITDYIEDSVLRFITNVDVREDIEDWQARVHDPFTRNKILAVLAKVIEVLPIASFSSTGDEDPRIGQIITNLYDYSEEQDDYEEFLIYFLLEAIVKGTAIGFEGHQMKERSVRDATLNEDGTPNIKENTVKENKLFGEIVRLEDFYPSSVGIRKIKDMPYCFWRTIIPLGQFLQDFSRFDRANWVQPQKTVEHTEDENRPFYLDFISSDVPEGHVEILRYYDKDVDQFILLANGVWLNPLEGEEIEPLPYLHKDLPFWEIKFEILGDFFYGKSMADKLKSMQDVLNVLTNMLLDQSFLTIFPPILTAGFDSIEDDYLRPGRRTPVDTQGLSLKDSYQTLDMGVPQGWHQFILDYTRKVMEEASVDQVSQGVAGVGGRTTAQEIRIAAEGVASMLGLFGRLVKYGIKRKARLRAKNILQFWTDSEIPVVQGVLGQKGAETFNEAFNTFKINETEMTNGKRGTKIIEIFAEKKNMPTQAELSARSEIAKIETGKEIEIIAVPASYLRKGLEFDIELIANPKLEKTKESERALHLEKVRVYMSFFPEFVDREELFAQTAEKFGDNPVKLAKKGSALLPEEGPEAREVDNGLTQNPTQNTANNAVRGMRSGEDQAPFLG